MQAAFYVSALVAVLATLMVVTRTNAVHALLYLIVSLLAVAVVFLLLGAPFAAALEVIIYAGAIMVLFVFVLMMLNLGAAAAEQEHRWLAEPRLWIGPSILCLVLLVELLLVLAGGERAPAGAETVGAEAVGRLLFGPYLLAVEIASMLLLAGLVGAFRLGRADERTAEEPAAADHPEAAERTPGARRATSATRPAAPGGGE